MAYLHNPGIELDLPEGYSRQFRIGVCRRGCYTLTIFKDRKLKIDTFFKAQTRKNDTLFKGKRPLKIE